jgi:retron-type reverse transcriptase
VSANEFLIIDKKEKDRLWEFFLYEKMLDDNEQVLLNDLNNYEERIRNIGPASSPIEMNLLKVYMEHIKNIRSLLLSLQNNRHETLKPQLEGLSTDPSSES